MCILHCVVNIVIFMAGIEGRLRGFKNTAQMQFKHRVLHMWPTLSRMVNLLGHLQHSVLLLLISTLLLYSVLHGGQQQWWCDLQWIGIPKSVGLLADDFIALDLCSKIYDCINMHSCITKVYSHFFLFAITASCCKSYSVWENERRAVISSPVGVLDLGSNMFSIPTSS